MRVSRGLLTVTFENVHNPTVKCRFQRFFEKQIAFSTTKRCKYQHSLSIFFGNLGFFLRLQKTLIFSLDFADRVFVLFCLLRPEML